jgi:hypothetical protein
MYEGRTKSSQNLNIPNYTQFRVLPLGTTRPEYSGLVCQVAMCYALLMTFSGIFSKCLQVCLAIFYMADLKEQSVCVKFCLLLEKTAAETQYTKKLLRMKPCVMISSISSLSLYLTYNYNKTGSVCIM